MDVAKEWGTHRITTNTCKRLLTKIALRKKLKNIVNMSNLPSRSCVHLQGFSAFCTVNHVNILGTVEDPKKRLVPLTSNDAVLKSPALVVSRDPALSPWRPWQTCFGSYLWWTFAKTGSLDRDKAETKYAKIRKCDGSTSHWLGKLLPSAKNKQLNHLMRKVFQQNSGSMAQKCPN